MSDQKLARALNSKVRRDILHILSKEQKSPVHIMAESLEITESSASKHLKMLYDLGLLAFHDEGKERFYSLRIKEIKKLLKIFDMVTVKIWG